MLYGSDLNTVLKGKSDTIWASFLQHAWAVQWKPDPEEKHIAISSLNHQIRLFDKWSCFSVDVEARQIGPGVVHLTFDSIFGRCILIETVTPIEPMVQRVLHRLYAPPLMMGPIGNFFVWGEAIMV